MKKFILWGWLFFIMVFFVNINAEPSSFNPREEEFSGLLKESDEFLGYKMRERPSYYGPENLFDYVNGGAALYLASGFKGLLTVEWARPGEEGKVIVLEIYDMGSLENAFGIFRTEKAGKDYFFSGGTEGSLTKGLLQFYKNNFYVKIIALFQSEKCQSVLKEFAHTLERRISIKEKDRG